MTTSTPTGAAPSLTGRRIVLTGVSRGVGLAIAREVLARGADVLGVARDAERLSAVQAELTALAPGRFDAVAVDLADPAAAETVADTARERWGAVDVLFNNAGIQVDGSAQTFEDESADVVELSLMVNLLAPLRFSLAFLPLLRLGVEPRLIHTSSGAGTLNAMGDAGLASYRLSKWALNGLTMLQAAHLAGEVAVNAFDPGWVRTDLGGPDAPGTVQESAAGALALLSEPFTTTGAFFKDGERIPW